MPYCSDFAVITSKLFSSEVFFAKSHFTEIWVESGLRAIKGCSNKLGIKEKIRACEKTRNHFLHALLD